jgi:HPt (histidine-containing phosphotransfer) domain-containing protein
MAVHDPAALAALADDLGDADVVRAVVRTYLDELPEQRERARSAAARGDAGAVRAVAHGLASASAVVGAHDLAAQCRRLEHDRDSAADALPGLVEGWDATCAATAAALHRWLDGG